MGALAYTISERIKSLITNNVAQETAVLMAAIIGRCAGNCKRQSAVYRSHE